MVTYSHVFVQMKVLKPIEEPVMWLGGTIIGIGLAWVLAHGLQLEPVYSARLWFGLAITYLIPGLLFTFALQPKHLSWPERLAWGIAASVLCMPTLLFLLTAHGLSFTPLNQVLCGLAASFLASSIFLIRLRYATTAH